jgi:hypothetical protein
MGKRMSVYDLIRASSETEQSTALEQFERRFGGDAMTLMICEQLSAPLAELTPDAYADLLAAYADSRRRYLDGIETLSAAWTDPMSVESRFHMTLYTLVQNLAENLEPVRPALHELLETRDPEMMGVATRLLEKMEPGGGFSFAQARQTMAQHGVNEYPYRLGGAVLRWVQEDLGRLDAVGDGLRQGADLERQGLCAVVEELGPVAAHLVDDIFAIATSESVDPETRSCAICALGSLGVTSERVVALLEDATRSPHWFIRGNAAAAAGRLRVEPDRFVPILIGLLGDEEGHDWCPMESALKALGRYGEAAATAISTVEALQRAADAEADEDPSLVAAIAETLANLRGQPEPDDRAPR